MLLAIGTLGASATAATLLGKTDATVVWVSVANYVPSTATYEMRNRDKSFLPPFLVIPAGASVRFPNDDPFYHSIYSSSVADPFDIGYYDNGPGKVVPFPKSGVVMVKCHIHAFMMAMIVVTDGPSSGTAYGTYRIDNVPPGKHTLHTWSQANGERTQQIDVPKTSGLVTLNLR
jgi:plastocyanin